jgi:adenylate cyclase
VRSRIIDNWETQDNPEHLRTIRDRILTSRQPTALLPCLYLYKQIVQSGDVVADNSPAQRELQLSGLVVKQLGKLRVYNPIYAAVFDQRWVDKQLAERISYGEAIAAWLASYRPYSKLEEPSVNQNNSSSSNASNTTQGTFAAFLAPHTQDIFKQVTTEVEGKLRVVNQTLSMLDSLLNAQGFDAILDEMLRAITAKTGEFLGADRTTIFVKDEERNQLWSIVAEDKSGKSLEIRIPADRGSIAADVATTKQVINIPYDLFDDPRSAGAKEQYARTGYRTYTMLALPLLNEQENLVAVVQLLNKLKPDYDPNAPLEERITLEGFADKDQRLFEEFAPAIRLILESSRSLNIAMQKQQATVALMKAIQYLSQGRLDLEETPKKLMDEARKLVNADLCVLWFIDRVHNDLWTRIFQADGSLKEIRVPLGVGFAGQVAVTGEILNIPFDLYERPDSTHSKKTDQEIGYRTCSLLCMPVFNTDRELIGVTQLFNKKKVGDFSPYNPENWPEPPDCWKTSFNQSDIAFMEAFNILAGVALSLSAKNRSHL